MTDGFWRIKQFSPGSPSGIIVTDISDGPKDDWRVDDHALVFIHSDGRIEHYPWASIVHAEYQPPTADESET